MVQLRLQFSLLLLMSIPLPRLSFSLFAMNSKSIHRIFMRFSQIDKTIHEEGYNVNNLSRFCLSCLKCNDTFVKWVGKSQADVEFSCKTLSFNKKMHGGICILILYLDLYYKKLGIEDSLLHPMRSYRHRQIMQVLSLGMNQQVDNFFIKLITYFSQPPVSLSNINFIFLFQRFTHFLISINFI